MVDELVMESTQSAQAFRFGWSIRGDYIHRSSLPSKSQHRTPQKRGQPLTGVPVEYVTPPSRAGRQKQPNLRTQPQTDRETEGKRSLAQSGSLRSVFAYKLYTVCHTPSIFTAACRKMFIEPIRFGAKIHSSRSLPHLPSPF